MTSPNPDCKKKYWRPYQAQFFNAKMRGIPFQLTYSEWLAIWKASGKLEQRGRKSHQFCMSRLKDSGAYAVGNVAIVSNHENASNNYGRKVQSRAERAKRSKTIRQIWAAIPPAQRKARVAKGHRNRQEGPERPRKLPIQRAGA